MNWRERLPAPWSADEGRAGADAAPEGSAPALELDGVAVELGGRPVLRDVSASVAAGEFVGLVGPNGAGKTTLLRTVTGVLAPDAGAVSVAGADVGALSSRAASRRVAAVPQDTALAFDFDVREVVAMGRTPYLSRLGRGDRADGEAVERALARTDVARFADRSIGDLSGGERQRVLLARALAQDAPLLLLDEPTASLDVHHQVRTLELARSLADEGRSVVAAIHDLNLAARYCDRLILLADGEIVSRGPPADVLTADAVESAFGGRAAVSADPVTGAPLVTALPDEGDAARPQNVDSPRVHVVGGSGAATALLHPLAAAGFEVTVGAVAEGSRDAAAADALGLSAVTVPPFRPVDETSQRAVADRVRAADVTVVADVPLGRGTLPNLAAAAAADALVLVEDRPIAERERDDGAARRQYERLRDGAAVTDPDGVVAAVAGQFDADPPTALAGSHDD